MHADPPETKSHGILCQTDAYEVSYSCKKKSLTFEQSHDNMLTSDLLSSKALVKASSYLLSDIKLDNSAVTGNPA